MNRFAMTLIVAAAVLLYSQTSRAGHAQIDTYVVSHTSQGSCASADMVIQGSKFYDINGYGIKSYTVFHNPGTSVFDAEGLWYSPFDSLILKTGHRNKVIFNVLTVNDSDHCTFATYTSRMSGPGFDIPLFSTWRRGTALSGETDVDLSLEQIAPGIARGIEEARRLINERREEIYWSRREASEANALLEQLECLESQLVSVEALFARGFDTVTTPELNAIWNSCDTSVNTRNIQEAMTQLFEDLKQGVVDLNADLVARGERLEADVQEITQGLDDVGLDPDASEFELPEFEDPGDVEVPELEDLEDPFDPEHDPYAEQADAILEQLAWTIQDDVVVLRDQFQTIVFAWREQTSIIEASFASSGGVSASEYNAFLNARERVLSFVQTYLDETGWFRDSSVPLATRQWVDEMLTYDDLADRAERLKSAFNRWVGPVTPHQANMLELGVVIAQGIQYLRVASVHAQEQAAVMRWFDSYIAGVGDVATFGIMLTAAGDFIDFCQLVLGRELCDPHGRILSTNERVLSGLGIILGSSTLWRSLGGLGKEVQTRLVEFVERLATLGAEKAGEIAAAIKQMGGYAVDYFEGVSAETIDYLFRKHGKEEIASRVAKGAPEVASKFNKLRRATEYGFGSYKELRGKVKGSGLQVHHLIEKRFIEQMGGTLGANTDDWLAIVVEAGEHNDVFTQPWRRLIGYANETSKELTTRNATLEDILNAAGEVYKDYPEILMKLGL